MFTNFKFTNIGVYFTRLIDEYVIFVVILQQTLGNYGYSVSFYSHSSSICWPETKNEAKKNTIVINRRATYGFTYNEVF